jgi:hypothetical protein
MMPIPEDQLATANALLRRREDAIPLEVRDRVKVCHRTEGNSIVLFEFRQRLRRPGEWHEEPVAKFKYIQNKERWRLYWMNRNLKWVTYLELPEASSFQELFEEVETDPCGCFWG